LSGVAPSAFAPSVLTGNVRISRNWPFTRFVAVDEKND